MAQSENALTNLFGGSLPTHKDLRGPEIPDVALYHLNVAITALRRIRSLDKKNVPKYAQQIAREALEKIER